MIERKNIENRVYDGKQCVGFSVYIEIDGKKYEFKYTRENETTWRMLFVLDRTQDSDSQVYNVRYTLPSKSIPLETLAATGLMLFQSTLQNEVSIKSLINFSLGEILNGNFNNDYLINDAFQR